jgi:hypothetical protein
MGACSKGATPPQLRPMLTHTCISLSALCTCVWQKEDGSQDEETAEVNRLHKGDYFGELALLTEQPRAATVTAVGDVECICLDTKGVPRTRTHPRAHETERERDGVGGRWMPMSAHARAP